jgi:hypothetical protein
MADYKAYNKNNLKRKNHYCLSSYRNRSYSIFYLLIIVFYLVRPVLPYFEYAINKSYIAENLCINKDIPEDTCDGKCYLHDKIAENSKPVETEKDDQEKFIPQKNTDDHLKSEGSVPVCYCENINTSYQFDACLVNSYFSGVFIPPRF